MPIPNPESRFSLLASQPALLDQIPLRIDRDDVLRFQGYKKGVDHPTDDVERLYEAALAEGERLMAPRVVYRSVPVRAIAADAIVLGDGSELHIPKIRRSWGEIEAVGVGIATIGDALEERVRALFEVREFPLAVMLDSLGSAAVESLVESANDFLCQAALPRLRVTNRWSPGHSGWDVVEQQALFWLCPGEKAGIALNDSQLMVPLKSQSFLVGIGREARVDHDFAQCRRCWMADCAYRRAGAASSLHP